MFGGDFVCTCTNKFPLMMMRGWVCAGSKRGPHWREWKLFHNLGNTPRCSSWHGNITLNILMGKCQRIGTWFVPTASIYQEKTTGTVSNILWKYSLYINIYPWDNCSVLCEDGSVLLLPEMEKKKLFLKVHRIFVILFL
jgi:hypothetical protein